MCKGNQASQQIMYKTPNLLMPEGIWVCLGTPPITEWVYLMPFPLCPPVYSTQISSLEGLE